MAPLIYGNRAFSAYLDSVVNRPVLYLALVVAVSIGFASHLPELSFKTTVYDLIIEDLPEAAVYQDFQKIFGSDEILRIVAKADNVFDPLTFKEVSRLSDAAGQINGVHRVLSLPEIKKDIDRGNRYDLNRFAALLKPATLFTRNLISEDGRSTIITLLLDPDSDKSRVVEDVTRLLKRHEKALRLYQVGIPTVSEAMGEYTRQDFFRLTPISLIIIAVVLFILYRNIHCLMLPLICAGLSCIWTFGFMAMVDIPVSMLTIIIPVFLIAVGTAYCLHICSAYLDAAARCKTPDEAVRNTFLKQAFPVALAVVTTTVGIGSLGINRIEAIREFALFTGFGMVAILTIVLTFFPAALTLMPLPKNKKARKSLIDALSLRVLTIIVTLNLKHRKRCLFVIGGFALFCATGILFLGVETNPVSFFKKDTDVSRSFHDIYKDMSGSFPLHVMMTGKFEDYFEDPAGLRQMVKLQEFLDTLPGVDKSLSLADYLKLVNYAYNQFDPKSYALPEDAYELRMLLNRFKIVLGADFFDQFLSGDYRRTNLFLLTHIASSSQFLDSRDKILSFAEKNLEKDVIVDVTGLGVVIAASSQLLTKGQIKSLVFSLVLILIIMMALFLSTKVGLIAVIPNLFPIVTGFGLMGWTGIPLSVATSLIASIAIGLAVDDTIHYLVRYNQEFKADLDKDRAMHRTLWHVGRPILFTSATIGLGFSILIFSHFQPTTIFGLLMVLIMFCALIGDLILLPILLLHVELVTAWDLLRMMPAMGGMSAGMIHEINQPLNAIKVGSNVMKAMLKHTGRMDPEKLTAVAVEISQQVDRASGMIQRFCAMGNCEAFEKAQISINRPVSDTVAIMESQLRLENIELKLDLADDCPPIRADHSRLMQVVYNLVENAAEAIAARRKNDEADRPHAIRITTGHVADKVVLTIEDTGCGIEPHIRERMFEPFFTTKKEGKGKGLGLSISNEIVRDCYGRIRVSSTPGQGTAVAISFPGL